MKKQDERVIDVQVPVNASLEQIWKALTEAEELKRWFPLDAKVEPGLGGEIAVSWGGEAWPSKIAAWDPPRHLKLTHTMADKDGNEVAFAIDYFVESGKDGLRVRLVHSGFGDDASWNDAFDGLEGGWSYFLFHLKHYVERHWGTPRDVAWARGNPGHADALVRAFGSEGFGTRPAFGALAVGNTCEISLGVETFTGTVALLNRPRTTALVLPTLNDAVLFVERESEKSLGIWLSTYGLPAGRVNGLRKALDELTGGLFV